MSAPDQRRAYAAGHDVFKAWARFSKVLREDQRECHRIVTHARRRMRRAVR